MCRSAIQTLIVVFAAVSVACAGANPFDITTPDLDDLGTLAAEHHKPGHGGGGGGGTGGGGEPSWSFADATAHGGVWSDDPNLLISTCPGTSGDNQNGSPYVWWPKGQECVVITTTDGTVLRDDPYLQVGTKHGKITYVALHIQDIAGPDGIQYETDKVFIDPPVEFTGAGFVLHVDADSVPIWEQKGHTGGPRVRQHGTIKIGDIVYR